MKELLQVRVEPEMREALLKLAEIYQLYNPDLCRLALSQFIMNNRMHLEDDNQYVVAMEEQEAYDNSIKQILTLNCLPCIECEKVYGVMDAIG